MACPAQSSSPVTGPNNPAKQINKKIFFLKKSIYTKHHIILFGEVPPVRGPNNPAEQNKYKKIFKKRCIQITR
jgi:hypothetical protein